MPRSKRERSNSGVYHVMLRGINRQNIFEDEEDRLKFLEVLKECKKKSGFRLFAYCLMGNHIHLLLKAEKEELEQIFRRIGSSYVYWYNSKYSRTGHLFQDRYKSEPVEDDGYFLTVLRYIHQNPQKAGLCRKLSDYQWSSYRDYIDGSGITDTEYALSMLGEKRDIALTQFEEYTNEQNIDCCLETEQVDRRLHDREALEIIKSTCGITNASEFQDMDTKRRNKIIAKLKDKNFSIRQISRLTGISFGIVRKQ